MSGRRYRFVRGNGDIEFRLRRYARSTPQAVRLGLLAAGQLLQAHSQKKVPVEYGLLRASAYTRDISKGDASFIAVQVGYSARYALKVHEAPGTLLGLEKPRRGRRPDGRPRKGKYWDPQGQAQPKFLESSIKSSLVRKGMRDLLLKIIRAAMRRESKLEKL